MESIIEVRNLDKATGKTQVLFDLNLDVKNGECLGVVGGNGAGKTTLLNASKASVPGRRAIFS